MKTHIIQLEPHDDVISTRDKMGWGKAGRILLVWPQLTGSRPAPLNRRVDLALLQRHSQSLGAQLALVSRDPDVRWNAGQLGIPVFKSLKKAQSARWRASRRAERPWEASGPRAERGALPPRPAPEPPLSPLTRLLAFTIGVLALLAIAGVLLPEARVALQPETRLQEINIPVRADPALDKANLTGRVPAHTVRTIVEGRDQMPASGKAQTPDWPAAGQVTFTNLTDQEVAIPKGTVVQTLGHSTVRFAVERAGTAPAGPGETVSLPVRALDPGSVGNLPGGSLIAIEGSLGSRLTVNNPEPTRGGKDRVEPAPTGDDRAELSDRLHAALRQSALEELRSGLEAGDVLLASSLSIERTLESTYTPEQGVTGETLEMSLRIEYRSLVVSHEDLRALAYTVLDANLPSGYRPLPTSLKIENEAGAGESGEGWELRASRQIQAQIGEQQAVSLSLGLPPGRAAERLAGGLPLEGPPQIALAPAWWPRLPFVPFRIHILISGGDPQG